MHSNYVRRSRWWTLGLSLFLTTTVSAVAAAQDYRNTADPRRPQPMVIEIEYDTDEKGAPRVANIKEWSGDDRPDQAGSNGSNQASKPDDDAAIEITHGDEPDGNGYRHRVEPQHYHLELPADWEPMSSDELNQCNQLARGIMGKEHADYHVGFRRRQSLPGTYPYILAQARPSNFKSFEEIERGLAAELPGAVKQAEGELRDLASNFSVGSAVLDRANNRLVMRMQLDVRGVGTVDVLSVGHLGKEETVFLHCYALEKDFSNWLPTFQRINDSFELDAGYEFVAAENREAVAAGDKFELPAGAWVLAAVVALGGGMMLGLLVTFIMRWRTAHAHQAIVLHPSTHDPMGTMPSG